MSKTEPKGDPALTDERNEGLSLTVSGLKFFKKRLVNSFLKV